ncbi:hypothetical protein CANARDRAFT_28934 [[Candida] arabinofermentans NRRL YB-2248]|uniref:Rab-GAP TBC domain-containing protein n=1 Tax=[Candida] arabinofermentans NRRL YB-2248 TaxID=983967 RepID=A0A1E4SZ58_9ASCO|nr:hypothetical protein CANARDRAFT_28934 [[Candida] arabinofermentans NRRL YB-2248]
MSKSQSSILDVIQESFEDISLNSDQQNGTKRIQRNPSSLRRSNSIGSNSSSRSLSSVHSKNSRDGSIASNFVKLNYSNPSSICLQQSNGSRDALVLTSSQRYRLNQKRRNNMKNSPTKGKGDSTIIRLAEEVIAQARDFLSDDELPDDLIVYNVPFSKSLRSLTDDEFEFKKPLPKRPSTAAAAAYSNTFSTMGSPTTRASSIFSIGSDLSQLSFYEDPIEINQSSDAKLLSINEDAKLNESLQRISILNNYKSLPNAPSSLSTSTTSPNVSMSKEKLSHLTPTRQINLPPKDKYEVMKHQRDCETLIQKQINIEKEKLNDRQKQIEYLSNQHEKDFISWKMIINNYDQLIGLPKSRELWWRGIPETLRYHIWTKQIGNKYHLGNNTIQSWLDKSEDIINKACDYKILKDQISKRKFEKENEDEIELIKMVEVHSNWIQSSFPNLLYFQIGATFESILRILSAVDLFRMEAGNLDSIQLENLTNLICVLFYNLRDEKATIITFTTLISRKLPYALMETHNNPENELSEYLSDIQSQFSKFLKSTSPTLHTHFTETLKPELSPISYLSQSISNMYSTQLPLPIISRIIDIYIFEGDSFLLRVELALLKKVSYRLMGDRNEILNILGYDCLKNTNSNVADKKKIMRGIEGFKYLDVGDEEEFIKDVRGILKKKG